MSISHHNKKNVAFTGGGSGWHILPILSLMHYIDSDKDCRTSVDNVYRFGEKSSMEYQFYKKESESFHHIHPQFIPILAGKYRRETIWVSRRRNFRDLFVFPLGILQSLLYLCRFRVDVVFCKGGYVSLPVVIAARILRKRIIVHDSDTTPWLTTRLASRFASKVFSGFPNTLPDSVCVGQILSDSLVESIKQKVESKITILVAWGSLGAQKLYRGVLQAITQLWAQSEQYFFIILNGDKLIQSSDLPPHHKNIHITGLIKDQAEMGSFYANADMAIVRGGTTTLAECKLFDLPLVIVPLPVTHDQAKNAQYYADQYGDTILSQNDPDFVDLLTHSILSAKQRSKEYDSAAILDQIQEAKKLIISEMLK